MPLNPSRLSPKLQELLEEQFIHHDEFVARFEHVLNVNAELARVSRGKQFHICHAAAWRGVVSTHDMLIIDLASWMKGLWEPGGFFAQFRGRDLKALGRKWTGDQSYGIDDLGDRKRLRDEINEQRRAAFTRVFREAAAAGRDAPNGDDIEVLKTRIDVDCERLRDDRNQLRAHRHEKESQKATAKELAFVETAQYLEGGARLMSDLHLLATNSWRGTRTAVADPKDVEAQDVVNLILLGSMGWIFGGDPSKGHDPALHYWQRREAHYDRLHAKQEKLDPELLFNDPTVSAALPSSE